MKLKKLAVFAALLVLSACASKQYRAEADTFCSVNGYNYDDIRYAECVEYRTIKAENIAKNNPYPTQAEFLCAKEKITPEAEEYKGCLKNKEKLVDSIHKQATAHLVALQKAEKEAQKLAEQQRIAREKAAEKARKEAVALQKAADTKQCQEYGFKRGSDKMSECIMKVQQTRAAAIQQVAIQEALMQQQAAIAEAQRKQAANAALLNYLGQQDQVRAINNQTMQQQYNSMRPVTCNRFGTTTTCY
jgi:hypothetical protein